MRVGCPFVWGAPLAAKMARHGCTNALLWAVMNGMAWDEETTQQAAHHGHLDTLSRALASGCAMDGTEVARKAASHGHLDILEWIIAKYSVKWGKIHTAAAARGGHLVTLPRVTGTGVVFVAGAHTRQRGIVKHQNDAGAAPGATLIVTLRADVSNAFEHMTPVERLFAHAGIALF